MGEALRQPLGPPARQQGLGGRRGTVKAHLHPGPERSPQNQQPRAGTPESGRGWGAPGPAGGGGKVPAPSWALRGRREGEEGKEAWLSSGTVGSPHTTLLRHPPPGTPCSARLSAGFEGRSPSWRRSPESGPRVSLSLSGARPPRCWLLWLERVFTPLGSVGSWVGLLCVRGPAPGHRGEDGRDPCS